MSTKVTHRVLTDDQDLSIDTAQEENGLSTSLVDSTGEKELPKIKILQNKPKKICPHRLACEVLIFSLMD